jgi:hypothetical protein
MESTEQKNRSLETVPTSQVTQADIATYEAWVNTEIKVLMEEGRKLVESVVDNASMVAAVEAGRALKGKLKTIDKTIEEKIVEDRRRRWKEATTFRGKIRTPIAALVGDLERAIETFRLEQERKRRAEEEARLAEIKKREEEEARRKAECEAEEKRRKEEHERKVLEAKINHAHDEAVEYDRWWTGERERLRKIEADKAERRKREEDARLEHAQAAQEVGEKEKADEILNSPTPVEPATPAPPPVPKPAPIPKPELPPEPEPIPEPEQKAPAPLPIVATPEVERVSGASRSTPYHAEVDDPIALMKWVIESGMSPKFLKQSMDLKEQPFLLNESWLNKQARKMKKKLSLPGVRAVPESRTTLRS